VCVRTPLSLSLSADHIIFAVDGIVIVNSSNYTTSASSLATQQRRSRSSKLLGDAGDSSPSSSSNTLSSSTSTDNPADDIKLWPIPFYLILNSAVGGGWPGEPDATTASPTYHVIDSVKVVREIISSSHN
jgi:hypothetical protein